MLIQLGFQWVPTFDIKKFIVKTLGLKLHGTIYRTNIILLNIILMLYYCEECKNLNGYWTKPIATCNCSSKTS